MISVHSTLTQVAGKALTTRKAVIGNKMHLKDSSAKDILLSFLTALSLQHYQELSSHSHYWWSCTVAGDLRLIALRSQQNYLKELNGVNKDSHNKHIQVGHVD